jgi:hypothetical protein
VHLHVLDLREEALVTMTLTERLPSTSTSTWHVAWSMAFFVLALLVACANETQQKAPPQAKPEVNRSAADLAEGVTTELDTASAAFGDGVLAELMGDPAAARAAFDRVLASAETPPSIAARAALRLAQMSSREGKRRDAMDLVARAEAFAPNDPSVARGVKQLRGDLVSAAGTDKLRGPPPLTPLPGVDRKVADAFTQAEKRLDIVHRIRVRPVFTSLYGALRLKEDATDALVAKYRQIAEAGGLAATAAHYRAGSLYHDFATSLFVVVLPPELGDTEQAQARERYRARAWANLEHAAAEYRAALDVPATPDADLWRLAAETELRRATALLEARGK